MTRQFGHGFFSSHTDMTDTVSDFYERYVNGEELAAEVADGLRVLDLALTRSHADVDIDDFLPALRVVLLVLDKQYKLDLNLPGTP